MTDDERLEHFQRWAIANGNLRLLRLTLFGVWHSLQNGSLDPRDIYSAYFMAGKSIEWMDRIQQDMADRLDGLPDAEDATGGIQMH